MALLRCFTAQMRGNNSLRHLLYNYLSKITLCHVKVLKEVLPAKVTAPESGKMAPFIMLNILNECIIRLLFRAD